MGRFLWLEAEETKKHKMLVLMVKDAMNAGLVSQRCLMETGEVDFLKEAGLVNDAKMWRDKEIRINTRTIYLQSK